MDVARGIMPYALLKNNGSRVRTVETREQAKQCGLAGTRRSEEHGHRRLGQRNAQIRLHFEAGRQPLAARADQLIGHTDQIRLCSAYVSTSTVNEKLNRNSEVSVAAV